MSIPIHIARDDGDIFTLPDLSYRERIALAQRLLMSLAEHSTTPRHLVSDLNRAIGAMTIASLQALRQVQPRPLRPNVEAVVMDQLTPIEEAQRANIEAAKHSSPKKDHQP